MTWPPAGTAVLRFEGLLVVLMSYDDVLTVWASWILTALGLVACPRPCPIPSLGVAGRPV